MPHVTFVEGERVSLHPLEEDDLAFVTEGVNHPQVRTPVGQSFPTSLARERRYLSELNERTDAVQLLVTADGDRAGVVELDPIDREAGVADLGIWIHPDRHGGGYAREAIELMIDYAFSELRVHKVTANAYATNTPSRKMLEAVGFVQEGVGREDAFFDGEYHDTHYFGLLEHEWDERTGSGEADPERTA
ncbi:GNAT family N-acetyltransferase [Salinigranum salinum]|uniref:GNAT family N-acetyltransferase n=1 Tax=Salinigranum salinum TaxID=1364937 RepID=UPI0012612F0D|nr:GNAT family protein [Salinigranum salinum]